MGKYHELGLFLALPNFQRPPMGPPKLKFLAPPLGITPGDKEKIIGTY